jgi:hypothetical protein
MLKVFQIQRAQQQGLAPKKHEGQTVWDIAES